MTLITYRQLQGLAYHIHFSKYLTHGSTAEGFLVSMAMSFFLTLVEIQASYVWRRREISSILNLPQNAWHRECCLPAHIILRDR